jgi:Zn-dependent M28 family amino/carboxypeptidase
MSPRIRALAPAALLCLGVVPLAAQSAPRPPSATAVRSAVESITEADVRQRIGVIAADSMRGRATPSPELEQTAAYIAAEFRRFGLRPGGDSGTFFQRYPLRKTQVDSSGYVAMSGGGATARWVYGEDVVAVGQLPISDSIVTGRVVLVLGTPTDTTNLFGDVDLRGAVVVQTAAATPTQRRGAGWPAWLFARAAAAGARGWIRLLNAPAGGMASAGRNPLAATYTLATPPAAAAGPSAAFALPVLTARDSTAFPVLQAAGVDAAVLRDGSARGVRALDGVTVTIAVRRRVVEQTSAPNVIGMLEGSDPQLKREFVFFTGHMDHIGVVGSGQCSASGADSICNGADDDASGTIGVVELAQAFATLTPRPRRTLVFMTVSGEERGLWGSGYYAANPEVPLAQTAADLNMDMIGRYYDNRPGWRDTIVVIGKEHSTLGEVANRVTREHPELRMRLIDDIWPEQNFYRRSDHFNFARKGVPILFFFNGTHPDYHRATDSVDKIDAEKAARIVRMVFYIGLEVANATARPAWNPASRTQIVEAGY